MFNRVVRLVQRLVVVVSPIRLKFAQRRLHLTRLFRLRMKSAEQRERFRVGWLICHRCRCCCRRWWWLWLRLNCGSRILENKRLITTTIRLVCYCYGRRWRFVHHRYDHGRECFAGLARLGRRHVRLDTHVAYRMAQRCGMVSVWLCCITVFRLRKEQRSRLDRLQMVRFNTANIFLFWLLWLLLLDCWIDWQMLRSVFRRISTEWRLSGRLLIAVRFGVEA